MKPQPTLRGEIFMAVSPPIQKGKEKNAFRKHLVLAVCVPAQMSLKR